MVGSEVPTGSLTEGVRASSATRAVRRWRWKSVVTKNLANVERTMSLMMLMAAVDESRGPMRFDLNLLYRYTGPHDMHNISHRGRAHVQQVHVCEPDA